MKCRVCHMPQPGPHAMSCRPSERKAAIMQHVDATYGPAIRSAKARAELLEGSTPWSEAPTMGVMLAQLDAFCARYAGALEQDAREMRDTDAAQRLWDKATRVRAQFTGRMR